MFVEGGNRPSGEQFEDESASEQSGVNPFDAFVERLASTGETPESEERGVQVVDPFTPFSLMDIFNINYERHAWNEIGFQPTEEQNQFVEHVKLAYGIIAHPFCEKTDSSGKPSHAYQWEIENQIAIERVYEGRNRVVLTDEEREILVKIANAAGIPCDPKRNEYFFDEIPRLIFEEEGFIHPKVVDSERV